MVKLRSRSELRKNIRLLSFFFIIVFMVVAVRSYFLQVLTPEEIKKRIRGQYIVKLTPRRGSICDRNAMELAVSIRMESLAARPRLIQNARSVAKRLAPVLGTGHAQLTRKLSSTKQFVWIQRKLTPAQSETIKAFAINGLEFIEETKRFYPNKQLAGQVLGFTGIDPRGLEGLERKFDAVLNGKPCSLPVDRDALGRPLFLEGIAAPDSVQGNDLILTIDKTIQHIAEKELQTAVALSRAKGGIAVVMDPWTGEVLALAVVPLFNPNQFAQSSADIWRNRALTDTYEPGSTFKTFLIASALEEGIISPQDIFFCENGAYRIGGRTIHDVHPHGWLDVTGILKYSSNIGASKISQHLGKDIFYQYIRKFGFGSETETPFPAEAAGFVPLPYRCSQHTLSAIGFGQGLAVTPLQMVAAYAAIANGGVLMSPILVKKIVDARGRTVREYKPVIRHRVVSPKTARHLNRMLQTVIDSDGTGSKAFVEGFSVAGKTGTSQKTEDLAAGYSRKKAIASFAGFTPAPHPRITVLVLIDEPQGVTYGGEIAAPVFSRIAHGVLNYLHEPPDRPVPNDAQELRANHTLVPPDSRTG